MNGGGGEHEGMVLISARSQLLCGIFRRPFAEERAISSPQRGAESLCASKMKIGRQGVDGRKRTLNSRTRATRRPFPPAGVTKAFAARVGLQKSKAKRVKTLHDGHDVLPPLLASHKRSAQLLNSV